MNDFITYNKKKYANSKYPRSKSGWIYHTHVTPIGDVNNNPLNDAFNNFLNDLKLDNNIVKKELEKNTPYRLVIKTEGEHDNIDKDGKFKKSKFLNNRKFRQKLIDYYNPIGIYVKGPLLKDFKDTEYWIIELTPIFENNSTF